MELTNINVHNLEGMILLRMLINNIYLLIPYYCLGSYLCSNLL